MCRRHALLPCANAWLSCCLAPHSKHLTPPNSSCNAIARGIVLGSTCVASKSGNLVATRNSPRFPRCRGGDAAKGSAPWRFPGALLLWGITHRRLSAARRRGPHGGREVLGGEGLLGGSCFNFDPAAAGGKPPPPRPIWVPRRSALRRASPRLPL